MVGKIGARWALLLLVLGLGSPAWAEDPCAKVENEPAVSRDTSVSINTAKEADLVPIPPIFAWETATLKLSGQVNLNRTKYQDEECFLFFCHDTTRIRNNFVSPDQYKVVLKLVPTVGEPQPVATAFGINSQPIPTQELLLNPDPRDSVRLFGAIAPSIGGIVRLGCGTDPDVCSEGNYTATVAIASGTRAKKLFEFFSNNRMSYSEIASDQILNENLRNSSNLIKQCVGRSLLAQANAFHGLGTGESPVERQKILQEALFWSPDDALVKGALAATYVETGQYAQARETGEDTVASLEKRIMLPSAEAGDYDALATAYATLAEVDWREVAGISTKAVNAGIADLNLALDRTDKRLQYFPFDKGADVARGARGGYAVRLAAMLARAGSLQGFEDAARTLAQALQVLPEPVAGRTLALDLSRGEIVSSIRIDRAVIDRAWSETRTELPLVTGFKLSSFPSDPAGTEGTRVAWNPATGEIAPIRWSAPSVQPEHLVKLVVDDDCKVTEAVGIAEADAAALVDCADSRWNIVTAKGVASSARYTGKARSLTISGAENGKLRRLFALVDEGVRSWTLTSDGNLTEEDKWSSDDWKGYDKIRSGPDPDFAAVGKGGTWRIVRLDSKPPLKVDLICAAADPSIHDVAFTGEIRDVLAVGPGCGLTSGSLSSLSDGVAGPPGALRTITLEPKPPTKIYNGAWPMSGEMRFAWAGRPTEPVAIVSSKGGAAKILAFAPPKRNLPTVGVEGMDLYVSDLDQAFSAAAGGDLRVRSLTFDARPIDADRAGKRKMWPNLNLEVRGSIGTLVGYDPLLRSPIQKTGIVNGADYRELRRGRTKIWGLSRDELRVQPLAELDAPKEKESGVELPDFKAAGSRLAFEINEGSQSIQVVWSTGGIVEHLAILPVDGSAPKTCGIAKGKFGPGVCSLSELSAGLGAGPTDKILVVDQHLSGMQPRTRPTALVVRKSASMDVFSFPLGAQPAETFPFGEDAMPIGFSDGQERTLFVLRDDKIAAGRKGAEVGVADAPKWAGFEKTVRVSSQGRLLLVGGEADSGSFGYRFYDANGDKMIAAACSPSCPLTPDEFRLALQDTGLVQPSWQTAFPLTIAADLSSVVFVARDAHGLTWKRSALGGAATDLKARPGLPLLYTTSPSEDVLSLQADRTTVEQWSFEGTGKRETPAKQNDKPPAVGPETSKFDGPISIIFFPEWSDQPLASSDADIASAVACLVGWPDAEISVVGHASATGAQSSNVALSTSRARRVVDILAAKGVSAKRLTGSVKGLGAQGAVLANPGFARRAEIHARGEIKPEQKARCGP